MLHTDQTDLKVDERSVMLHWDAPNSRHTERGLPSMGCRGFYTSRENRIAFRSRVILRGATSLSR